MPRTQRRRVTRDSHLRGLMRSMARHKQARMPMAPRGARSARATVMAVSVARAATVRSAVIAQSAVSAKTVRRRTASSRWTALQLIPEDQMHRQPPLTVHRVLAILQ